MDRTAARNLLTSEYSDLAADAKFDNTQTTTAYNTAIDMSLRRLGVEESDLATADVEQENVMKYIALLNYNALKRFSRLLSIRFDVAAGSGAIDAKRSQAFKQIQSLLSEAEEECAGLGVPVGAGAGDIIQSGRLSLGFLSRSCRSEF